MGNILKRLVRAMVMVALAPMAIAGNVMNSMWKIYGDIWKIIQGE